MDEREEELSSITAIFPELVIQPDDPFSASIELPVAPLAPLNIAFPSAAPPTPPTSDNEGRTYNLGPGRAAGASKEVHQLAYLPPLMLQITLPEGYPAEKPPQFELAAGANWVPENVLKKLVLGGEALWEEYGRGQVVFAYIDSLQQAAERCFDLVDKAEKPLEMPANMKIELLDFNMQAKRRQFEQETFDCGVCLEPKKGSVCYRMLRCGHVFCVGCLQDFYNSCITEGDVSSVKCIDPSCGKEGDGKKKDRTLNPSELLQIPIDKAMVQRYAELKRKKKIESDKDTIYCPRNWCQGFARSSKHPKITDITQVPDSDSESDTADADNDNKERASRLTICEKCDYAFCRVCLAGWHGEYVRCYPRNAKELSEEEQASYNWLRRHTSPCPTCSSPCQKTHGCNHMVCFQCRTHFCYLCSAWLDSYNPYEHFNTEGTPCYMRLWELEEGDEAEGNARNDMFVDEEEDDHPALPAREQRRAAAVQPNPNHANPLHPRQRNQHGRQRPPAEPGRFHAMRNGPNNQRRVGHQERQRGQGQGQGRGQGRGGRGGNGGRGRRGGGQMGFDGHISDGDDEPAGARGGGGGIRGARAGVVGAAAPAAADPGIQRFLRMVVADEEDGWDSDELDGDDQAFAIPVRD
ncbi:RING finger protein [Phyllosticta capitalensis]